MLFFAKHLSQLGVLRAEKGEKAKYVLGGDLEEQSRGRSADVSLSMAVVLSQLSDEKDFDAMVASFTARMEALGRE